MEYNPPWVLLPKGEGRANTVDWKLVIRVRTRPSIEVLGIDPNKEGGKGRRGRPLLGEGRGRPYM